MLRLSPWRLVGLGFVLASAVGVAASIGFGLAFGALWGVGIYAATTLLLLAGIGVAIRFAPPASSEAETWLVAEAEAAAGTMAEGVAESAPLAALATRPARRLSDKITGAFEHACQNGDVALAEKLLESLELLLLRGPSAVEERALRLEMIIAGRNRLAAMRGPDAAATVTADQGTTVGADS